MGRKKSTLRVKDEYAGWPSNVGNVPTKLDVVHPDIDPKLFWEKYISQRKPVLIDGPPQDPSWKATERWSPDYLRKIAGLEPVLVEHRKNIADTFGRGQKIAMPFGEVLRRVFSGDDTIYMTTQEAPLGPDGHPEVLAPPTAQLAADFPLQPALLGNLVPQQINIWMGCAPEGSTTGLHHDFHDNLYVLLKGKKRFRLFTPPAVRAMYVHGTPVRVHPNGRIVYRGSGNILADGSDAKEVAVWRAKRDAEKDLVAAEAAVIAGEHGAQERMTAAERVLDDVLELALESAFDDVDFDDFEALEHAGSCLLSSTKDIKSDKINNSNATGEPESFSRVDLSLPAATLHSRFPLFPGLNAAIECEVSANQCLYLPAGWFHEVTSYSGGGGTPEIPGSNTEAHIALNFWAHPPDVSDPSAAGFNSPYSTDYWNDLWESRRERYHSALDPNLGGGEKIDHQSSKRKKTDHHNSHGHGCGCEGEDDDDDDDGDMSPGEKSHFFQCTRGMFGFGRRQHLHRFVQVRFRPNKHNRKT